MLDSNSGTEVSRTHSFSRQNFRVEVINRSMLIPCPCIAVGVSSLTMKILLPMDVRIRMFEEFVNDHLRKTGNSLVNEISFGHAQEEDLAEMHATTVSGHLMVKVSDKTFDDKELQTLYESSNENRVYETLVISSNKPEDRRTRPQPIYDNMATTGWFRVRNIEDVTKYLSEKYKFGVLFDKSDAYLISTPRAVVKRRKPSAVSRSKS
jgi:hypothetical protein